MDLHPLAAVGGHALHAQQRVHAGGVEELQAGQVQSQQGAGWQRKLLAGVSAVVGGGQVELTADFQAYAAGFVVAGQVQDGGAVAPERTGPSQAGRAAGPGGRGSERTSQHRGRCRTWRELRAGTGAGRRRGTPRAGRSADVPLTAPGLRLTRLPEGRASAVIDARVEDALVLAETALTTAQRALDQAVVAERAASLSTQLAREALQAAQAAHDLAQQADPANEPR